MDRQRSAGYFDVRRTSALMERPLLARKLDVRGLGSKVCRGGPPSQSACAPSFRCGRSRSGHPARLAGYLGGQVINSGEEQFENRRGVCLVVT